MMSTSNWFAATFLFLSSLVLTTPARAQYATTADNARPIARVAYNSAPMSGYTYQPTAPQPTSNAPQSAYAYGMDPYGFMTILNSYRARAGLSPVSYDPSLSSWASQNNAACNRRGLGHHVNPNCFQNCGWNYSDVYSVARGWMNSKGHRQNMLAPSITRFGIAYGPGPYWTMNAR